MTQSSSFGRADLNAFLFASVGADKSGVELTVLSALTRLGFDPWQEAARLSELPRETAARTLATAFALLPEGDWKTSQGGSTAARLVDCLPAPGATPAAAPIAGKHPRRKRPGPMKWLFWMAIAVGWFFLVSYLTTNSTIESAATVTTSR
jgi:hypothetical protein